MSRGIIKLQIARMQQLYIEDLTQFFTDKKIEKYVQITVCSDTDVKFYNIKLLQNHFSYDASVLFDELRAYGYEPKRFVTDYPNPTMLVVLVRKQI